MWVCWNWSTGSSVVGVAAIGVAARVVRLDSIE